MAASVVVGTMVGDALGMAAFVTLICGGGLLAQAKRKDKTPRQKSLCHLK